MDNRCVCCGAIIPEGLQVCPQCMKKAEHTVCRRCGRKLKTPDAIKLGMGKVCFKKSHTDDHTTPLFEVKKCKE